MHALNLWARLILYIYIYIYNTYAAEYLFFSASPNVTWKVPAMKYQRVMYQRQQNNLYSLRWEIMRKYFLRYLNIPYFNLTHHKLKTFPIIQAVNQ